MLRFFLILLLVGCGTEIKTVEVEKKIEVETEVPFYIEKSLVDSNLMPHVMEFAGYCERYNISELCQENFKKITSIRLVQSFKEQNVVGKCYVSFSANKRWIEIFDWKEYDSLLTKTLVMHEVAHCVLGNPYPHYNDDYDIMNSYLLPEKLIQIFWPQLIKAMFVRAGGQFTLTYYQEYDTVSYTTIDETGNFSCEKQEL